MAAEGPNPRTFSSWEDAFQHPVPAVRGMEKQLRRDIDSNKEKLRALVGASYRGLLGTAESIIEMNGQMHNVENHLAEIGQKCNTRLLEKKATNFNAWEEEVDEPGSTKYTLASQLSVLRSCPDAISRLLKIGGSVLLAAKVLVLSRLLHTKLSKRSTPVPYLETLRNRLATLRRRLLARIDRRLKLLDASRDALLEAMCAFVLATSSSLTDVVRHFHHLRLEAIADCMQHNSDSKDSTLQALKLYVKTLKDSQTLLPVQLAHGLERLKAVSIFKSSELHNLTELNLDMHERWIDDDIKTFTPYIRHDDLSRGEAEKLLKQWARLAVSSFLKGLKNRIQKVHNPAELTYLRKEVLELWLSQHQHALGIDSAETLDGLRDVFNTQAVAIIRQRVFALEGVATTVQQIIQDWQKGKSDLNLSLWDPSISSLDTAHGGKWFCDTIANRLEGKNEPFSKVSTEYTQWLENISAVEETIKSVHEAKWDDAFDDVDEDDGLLDDKQLLLSKDDPLLLEEELSKALIDVYSTLENALDPAHLFIDKSDLGPKSVFLLRVWRDLRSRIPRRYSNLRLGLRDASHIESTVVEFALLSPLKSCSKRLTQTTKGGDFTLRALWEGSPELPVLPSPWTYRLLVEVVQSMSRLGADIWNADLSALVKNKLAQDLPNLLQKNPVRAQVANSKPIAKANGHLNKPATGASPETDGETHDNIDETSNGNKENDRTAAEEINGTYVNGDDGGQTKDGEVNVRNSKVQRLFDILYLAQATSVEILNEKNEEGLNEIQLSLRADIELDTKSFDKLNRNAGDYWKRTKLLFALL